MSAKFISGHPIDCCMKCGINKVDKKSDGTSFTLPGTKEINIEDMNGKTYKATPHFPVCKDCYDGVSHG